jgi:hypothetical protein
VALRPAAAPLALRHWRTAQNVFDKRLHPIISTMRSIVILNTLVAPLESLHLYCYRL